MLSDDASLLKQLATAAVNFSLSFGLMSLITALALQAVHEGWRTSYNRIVVSRWLRLRQPQISFQQFVEALGYDASGSGLMSLPYWQLTGQIGASINAKINSDPLSAVVCALGNIDEKTSAKLRSTLKPAVEGTSAPPNPVSQTKAEAYGEIAMRAQIGINTLHAYLRSWWNIFDYYGSIALLTLILGTLFLMGGTEEPRADKLLGFLYFCIFAWLATPVIRRMMERLIVFR